jgi:murein DD-endopeptidase MepM/ murein hydrolase activator NlpD
MNADQREHYEVLMLSRGARQFVGNPFGFNWLPFITSHYGYRIHPITGERNLHLGIDIGLPEGTEIRAGFNGMVIQVGYDAGGFGNFVVIENDEGIQARYAHCFNVLVGEGQVISIGDIIATVGNTGSSTGAHLHMEVVKDGRHINPIFFVDTGAVGN